jgi:hypothetical protein
VKRLKIFLSFLVIGITIALIMPQSIFGENPEFEIVCPPNEGITKNGYFSDEPLKMNLNNGVITRINPVNRAIAMLACETEISVIEELVTLEDGITTLLANQNIDIDTIVVRNSDAPFNFYFLNLDYEIFESGSFVEISRISIINGGSIPDGKEVFVDYIYSQ